MSNHMKKIAEMFGVEVGEVFQVGNDDSLKSYYLRFSKIGLEFSKSMGDNTWVTADSYTLLSLLRGELPIKRLPWKPSCGDVFYMPSVISENKYVRLFWHDSGTYKSFYQQGKVCRTKEEAIELAEEMLDIARKRFAGDR